MFDKNANHLAEIRLLCGFIPSWSVVLWRHGVISRVQPNSISAVMTGSTEDRCISDTETYVADGHGRSDLGGLDQVTNTAAVTQSRSLLPQSQLRVHFL